MRMSKGETMVHIRGLLKAIRVYQWVKNLLVFVPAITSQVIFERYALEYLALLFLSFSLASSGSYLLNDYHDLDADRAHPGKSKRPFASGELPIGYVALAPVLMIAGGVLAWSISPAAAACVLGYLSLALAYSLGLKRIAMVDVFILAALYTLRVFAGAVALSQHPSIWILAFAGFCFLALAFVKRSAEIAILAASANQTVIVPGRGYQTNDRSLLQMMGIGSAFAAAMVMALYVDSDIARSMYVWPEAIFVLVPVFLFWQCRLWLAASRGLMHDDPIIYTAQDRVSWLVALSAIVIIMLAIFGLP
jgi:4-hydroxybenzoate polyprenyltransferase